MSENLAVMSVKTRGDADGQLVTKIADASGVNKMAIDASGRLSVAAINDALPAGTNILGQMKLVDAAGTNQLAINSDGKLSVYSLESALPSGSNTIGKIDLNSGSNTVGKVYVTDGTYDLDLDANGKVYVRSIEDALPAGTNTIGKVDLNAGSNTIGKVDLNAGSNTIGSVKLTDGTNTATFDASGRVTANTNADGSASGGTAASTSLLSGGVANSAGLSLTNGQQAAMQLDPSGRLKVNVIAMTALPAGSNTIGSVKLTDGTDTMLIDSSGRASISVDAYTTSLPAGTNILGQMKLVDAAGANQLSIDANGKIGINSVTSITNALPSGSNTIGKVDQGVANTATNGWFVKLTDGTDTMSVDSSGRASISVDAFTTSLPAGSALLGQIKILDGIGGINNLAIDANGKVAVSSVESITNALPSGSNTIGKVDQGVANTASNGWFVKVTDGTNTMPTGDVAGRPVFVELSDGAAALGTPTNPLYTSDVASEGTKKTATATDTCSANSNVTLSPATQVSNGTTGTLKRVLLSAAGPVRAEIQKTNGTLATTVATVFLNSDTWFDFTDEKGVFDFNQAGNAGGTAGFCVKFTSQEPAGGQNCDVAATWAWSEA